MSTVATLIDRVYRDGIRLASQQPMVVLANAAATAGDTSIDLDVSVISVDEQELISPGIVLENGLELILVRSVSITADVATCTVLRGYQGTTAEAISEDDVIVVAPDAPRKVVFDAVAAEIVDLYPQLWATQTDEITSASTYTEVDADAVEVESWRWLEPGGSYRDARAVLLRNFTPSSTTKAVTFPNTPDGKTGYITLRLKFPVATAESDDVQSDLLVDANWEPIVVAGAIYRTLLTIDPSRLSVEWSTEAQEAQVAPPGTGSALAQRFKRERDDLLEKAARQHRTEHPGTVKWTDPFAPWSGA